MTKPRKQTYTMDMYLNKIKDRDIRSDADVQRMSGQWDFGMINELIVTVLTGDYIPPIILGEETSSQLWIIDGLQRSTSLMSYRYGNYKITSTIDDSIISYKTKIKDEDGKIKIDENGDIIWEDVEFDIKNKTYEQLPEELKKRFREYQIETVIHENCDMKRISKLIKRYNNHTSMNTTQKAFTYIDNFARDIRGILNNKFFVNCGNYTEKERTKGILERVVLESVMCMFHFDNWKKQTKQISAYLNENATKEEFVKLENNLCRLENIITDDIKDIFNSKDSFIWLTLYDRFTSLGLNDERFAEFLRSFKANLRNKQIDGQIFDEVDKGKGTKDKTIIMTKLHILETLMYEFLHINKEDLKEINVLEFIKENVDESVTEEDVENCFDFYENDLKIEVDNSSRLLDSANTPSILALVMYIMNTNITINVFKKWLIDFFNKNNTYIKNQKENYLNMINSLNTYMRREVA